MEDPHQEVENVLRTHLTAIQENDLETYHRTTSPDLTLYEWWITPHRIDGLGFHDFMMDTNAARGTTFGVDRGADASASTAVPVRFDLANLKIQRYDKTAIASYTLLASQTGTGGVVVYSHNESRVLVQKNGRWLVVHAHKSPAWPAPHVQA